MEQTDVKITNIKCSIKVQVEAGLDDIQALAKAIHNWSCSRFSTYLVIKLPGSLRLIIFKPRESSSMFHVNVTGIKKFEDINSHLQVISNLFICPLDSLRFTVDNVTAKSDAVFDLVQHHTANKKISLNKLKTHLAQVHGERYQLRLHTDSCCGLVIKVDGCTILVYQSGKTVIIGSKDVDKIRQIIRQLCTCIENIIVHS